MGYVDVAGVSQVLPDGRVLFAALSFRVGEGAKVALVGPDGAGTTTLRRRVAGDLPVSIGVVPSAGGLGVVRQFIGMIGRPVSERADSGRNDLAVTSAATADRTLAEFAL